MLFLEGSDPLCLLAQTTISIKMVVSWRISRVKGRNAVQPQLGAALLPKDRVYALTIPGLQDTVYRGL